MKQMLNKVRYVAFALCVTTYIQAANKSMMRQKAEQQSKVEQQSVDELYTQFKQGNPFATAEELHQYYQAVVQLENIHMNDTDDFSGLDNALSSNSLMNDDLYDSDADILNETHSANSITAEIENKKNNTNNENQATPFSVTPKEKAVGQPSFISRMKAYAQSLRMPTKTMILAVATVAAVVIWITSKETVKGLFRYH